MSLSSCFESAVIVVTGSLSAGSYSVWTTTGAMDMSTAGCVGVELSVVSASVNLHPPTSMTSGVGHGSGASGSTVVVCVCGDEVEACCVMCTVSRSSGSYVSVVVLASRRLGVTSIVSG